MLRLCTIISSETVICADLIQNYGCDLVVDVERGSSRGGVNANWRARPGVVGEAWGAATAT